MKIQFFVEGKPEPGGSKRAFYVPKLKRAVVTDDNPKAKDWKALVKAVARKNYLGDPLGCALRVFCLFTVARPKHHYRTGKKSHLLRDNAPQYPTTKPDGTKLFRSTEDALTGVIWDDDAQVVSQTIQKRYAELGKPTGAYLIIEEA